MRKLISKIVRKRRPHPVSDVVLPATAANGPSSNAAKPQSAEASLPNLPPTASSIPQCPLGRLLCFVQFSGRLHDDPIRVREHQASGKRQGTKSREAGHPTVQVRGRKCAVLQHSS